MRLVHLSDLHLGYRQYQRLTPGGVNQREADVAATFRATIDRVIALAPDAIVIAGDIFHTVRPTNQAILHAFIQFGRLTRSLPDAVVVLVAGNHDTPRSAETGGILPLFRQLGIQVVDRDAELLTFPDRDLSILAVPDVLGIQRPSLKPAAGGGGTRYNVLLLHGEVQGMLPASVAASDRAAVEIAREDLHAKEWDYVALGHYHVYREIAPNAYYSGSIDYTSANTWGELYEERVAGVPGKGFVEHDLESGAHHFHPIPPARSLIDLPHVNAHGLGPAEVDARIRAAIDMCEGGIDDKVVRLTIREIPRSIVRELDHKAIREYKRRALNFNLDLRAPERRASGAPGAPGSRRLIELKDVVREKLAGRPLDADIDRAAFVQRALDYIDQAQAAEVAPAALAET